VLADFPILFGCYGSKRKRRLHVGEGLKEGWHPGGEKKNGWGTEQPRCRNSDGLVRLIPVLNQTSYRGKGPLQGDHPPHRQPYYLEREFNIGCEKKGSKRERGETGTLRKTNGGERGALS